MLAAFVFLAALCLVSAQNDPPTADTNWIELKQSDFDSGTYRIETPGYYRLMEDVWFNPKAPTEGKDAWASYQLDVADYKSGGGPYDDLAYQIGFWAGITVEVSQVTIDLNGHIIGQHPAHNLMNRYFNVIELATQPFVSGQGFHNFGPVGELAVDTLFSASYVSIYGGRIGRAATNGIHGTGNKNIHIHDIEFSDFETSAVSLYGADTVVIERCVARGARDVQVTSLFDTALHLRPFLDFLEKTNPSFTLRVQGQNIDVTFVKSQLRELINEVYDAVIVKRDDLRVITPESTDLRKQASALFSNDFHRPDGNCFGFSVTSRNLDVDGFPWGYREVDTPSTNINITDCVVDGLECAPTEVVALTSKIVDTPTGSKVVPVLDPRGHVFSLLHLDFDFSTKNILAYTNATLVTISAPLTLDDFSTSSYLGNPVSNGQAIIGKAVILGFMNQSLSGLNVRKSSFNKDLIAWIEATPGSDASALSNYFDNGPDGERNWICNGDETYRVQMGVAGFRVASTWNSNVKNNQALGIVNYGVLGSYYCAYTNATRSHPSAVLTGYGGADARGFVFASVRNLHIYNNYARWIFSNWGTTYGFDLLTDSSWVLIDHNAVRQGEAGKFIPEQVELAIRQFYNDGPTRYPISVGFHTDQRSINVVMTPYCVNALNAPLDAVYKTALAPSTNHTWTEGDGEWSRCHTGDEDWWIWLLLAFVCLVFVLALVALIMACSGGGDSGASYQEMR